MKFSDFLCKFKPDATTFEKEKILLSIRWVLILFIFIWWWFTSDSSVGIALILVLSFTALVRMQFSNSFLLIVLEIAACFLSLIYWPGASLAFILPVFESGLTGHLWGMLFVLLLLFLKWPRVSFGINLLLFFMAFSVGYIVRAWSEREKIYVEAVDNERKQRYELDALKNELIAANIEVAQLVETTERNRIAQQLHDNVGHEIAGALIALQTYKKLEEKQDPRAAEIFNQVLNRVESSSLKLRETVYQLKPHTEGGASRLQRLCDEFTFCRIGTRFVGEIENVPAIAWVILEPCLKEALTNIIKYSKATEVEVRYDISPYIIRMNIKDNGVGADGIKTGFGLFGIRERIRAAGGTVSIDSSDGFMLTCILPIDIY